MIVTEDVDGNRTQHGKGRRGSLDSGDSESGATPMHVSGASGPSSLGVAPGARPRAGTWSIPSGYRSRNASGQQGSSTSVSSVSGLSLFAFLSDTKTFVSSLSVLP